MPAKRWVALTVAPLLLSSMLLSQSLAEIAQKERERRAALKGQKVVVVTNAELGKVKRKPAVDVGEAPPAAPAARPSTAESEQAALTETPAAAAKPPETPTTAGAPPGPAAVPQNLQVLQERWDKSKEYVELLTLKMSALWQEFNGLRDPHAQDAVRQSISETYAKLHTAQEEETKARLEFERSLGEAKKESTPQLWIK
jgi:hypothetical protein